MMLLLAPMEGLLDACLRDVLTQVGGMQRCVSEFVRVTDSLLPVRVFTRLVPELLNGGLTRTGVPVRPQLLGSDPHCLAENAQRLAELSPAGVDLNFGCPAKVVNRHGGGAALLGEPEVLHRIVGAVRRAVPSHLPVSAKMRLGIDDDRLALDCALALADAGASEIVVHARTKQQGYRPPAYWESLAPIRQALNIPVIANGEIWTVDDARRCRAESGCRDLMLGRGQVADPGLALAILADEAGRPDPAAPFSAWAEIQPLLLAFAQQVALRFEPRHRAGRLKQWLFLLQRRHDEAGLIYERIRTQTDSQLVLQIVLEASGLEAQALEAGLA
jgi:tRNA-dihydrouridine synthase C